MHETTKAGSGSGNNKCTLPGSNRPGSNPQWQGHSPYAGPRQDSAMATAHPESCCYAHTRYGTLHTPLQLCRMHHGASMHSFLSLCLMAKAPSTYPLTRHGC